MEDDNRVILFVDVDAFSIQVLQKDFPEFANRPCVCVILPGGQVASVSYEAKSYGITRKTTLDEAKILCPDLHVFTENLDSEDFDPLEISRRATWDITKVVEEFIINELGLSNNDMQVASADEIYVDITIVSSENLRQFEFGPKILPHIYFEDEEECSILSTDNSVSEDRQIKALLQGGFIGQRLCQLLQTDVRTRFKCSAGIGRNKLLAKLSCGLHRPNSVTVLTSDGTQRVSSFVKVENIPGLGKKRGQLLKEKMKVATLRDLKAVPEDALTKLFGSRVTKEVLLRCNWVDDSPVSPAKLSDEIICRRRFQTEEDCPAPSYDKIVEILGLVSKRMALRLVEEKERCQRQPSKLKLGMKPGAIVELVFDPDNLSWEALLNSALDKLSNVYDESKALRVKEISIYANNFYDWRQQNNLHVTN